MRTKPLFDMDTLPTRQPVNASHVHYHLYFIDKSGERRYLYPCRELFRHWQWLTEAEAGKRRKRKAYYDSTSAHRSQRAWQRDAKDGIVVKIEGYEVAP